MNKQFTPGPWKVEEAVTGEQCIGSENSPKDGGDVVCMMPDKDMLVSRSRWPANSALICAAPEMFELLEKIANDPYGYDHEDILPLLTKITTP